MKHNNGTFVAVRFHEETVAKLIEFGMVNAVPNLIDPAEYHSTVAYSRKYLPNVPEQRNISPNWIARPIGFDVFFTKQGAKCLVLKIDCPDMVGRHRFLRHWEGASHDFPSYNPHITFSYDIGDYDLSRLPSIVDALPEILIVQEYCQELIDVDRRKEARQEEG
jgi:hypothetical protein